MQDVSKYINLINKKIEDFSIMDINSILKKYTVSSIYDLKKYFDIMKKETSKYCQLLLLRDLFLQEEKKENSPFYCILNGKELNDYKVLYILNYLNSTIEMQYNKYSIFSDIIFMILYKKITILYLEDKMSSTIKEYEQMYSNLINLLSK